MQADPASIPSTYPHITSLSPFSSPGILKFPRIITNSNECCIVGFFSFTIAKDSIVVRYYFSRINSYHNWTFCQEKLQTTATMNSLVFWNSESWGWELLPSTLIGVLVKYIVYIRVERLSCDTEFFDIVIDSFRPWIAHTNWTAVNDFLSRKGDPRFFPCQTLVFIDLVF